jgi:hypothetical protein
LALQKKTPDALEVYYARIGLTLREGNLFPTGLLWYTALNRDDQVGLALAEVVKNGYKSEIISARELTELATQVQTRSPSS